VSRPLVSVVTPVYNGAEFIQECVDSVLAQTYENWEYVIVDNCSTDGTLEIVRQYEQRDRRIRVVTPGTFVGAIENANRAVCEISAESQYTKALHADDWLFPECLERMVALAEANPSVGVVSAYRLEETRVTLTGLPHSVCVLPGHEICRATLLAEPYPNLFGSPSSLLVRSDLIRSRHPFYNVNNPFQDDQEACYEILQESDFGFVHQVLTFTRRPETSPFSFYARIGAELPGQINLLQKFGPIYLPRTELQRRLAILLVHYGVFLLRSLPRMTDPDLRAYQGRAFREAVRTLQTSDVLHGIRLQVQRKLEARRPSPAARQP
jgi:glycosyltransferase involved in cell wall biosynthesis